MLRHFYFGGGKRLIDITTPTQVVNAAYDTFGNGGRKLVRLENGWLVGAVGNSGTDIKFYVSKDNGSTFTYLGFRTYAIANQRFAISSNGNNVYLLFLYTTGTAVSHLKFDATEANGDNLSNLQSSVVTTVDSSQTSFDSCSLTIDTNGHLHAAWASKNATYSNSFNIRYSKSIDGGATWSTPTQLTTNNTTGTDMNNPCIVIAIDNNPIILFDWKNGVSDYRIRSIKYNGSSWNSQVNIYSGSTYTQSNPCAVVDSNGIIHVVWHGYISGELAASNIRYSKSTDNGLTWSTMYSITSGNTRIKEKASITCDKDNNLYVLFRGTTDAAPNAYRLHRCIYNGVWGAVDVLTLTGTTEASSIDYPSTCDNYKDFTDALCIYQDKYDSTVKFRGKFYVN